ncbi:hypothetical protein KPL71_000038 [Citrus sinensis]|uniref:Uncharacterized protein n=1 Tax=Citrus sinensis TaxID=2711 RepID=A0ACB8NKI5_CITSI|nr:hypothetical protein KPL71_000038 [Citrus sinensis]
MKTARAWKLGGIRDFQMMAGYRQQRPHLKRPIWIIAFVTFFIIFLTGVYVYPSGSGSLASCYFFSGRGCTMLEQLPATPTRELTDAENIAQVVFKEILNKPPVHSKNPKVAFMFLTPGNLPFENLWEKFFHVAWGRISMLDAEKRLLAHALLDPDNQQFVLLSDSCIPLHNFDYVYNYLMYTNVSYVDCFEDPGPHGNGRYSEHMLPEVEKKDFRKGSQMIDPAGIANWSVTHADWSEGKWHPKAYRAQDISSEFLKSLAAIDETFHITSDEQKKVTIMPCMWNGMKRPCYLFARKFNPEALDKLVFLFVNYTTV